MVNTRDGRNYNYSTVKKEEEKGKEGRLMKCSFTKHECNYDRTTRTLQFINGDRSWMEYQCEKHKKHPNTADRCSICRWNLHYIYPYCHTCGNTLSDPFSRALFNFIVYFVRLLYISLAAGLFFLGRDAIRRAETFTMSVLILLLLLNLAFLALRAKF